MHRFNADRALERAGGQSFYNLPGADKSNYAYGLRNTFDFTFDPVSGQLFATDNGDECDDEINLIRSGYNYGWRLNYPQTPLPCDDDVGPDPRYNTIPPLFHWTPSIAPTGITFYHWRSHPRMEERSVHVCVQGWFYGAASLQVECGAHGHHLAHDHRRDTMPHRCTDRSRWRAVLFGRRRLLQRPYQAPVADDLVHAVVGQC